MVYLEKTNFVYFVTRQRSIFERFSPSVVLDSHGINEADETRFLGVIVDRHLSWEAEFERVIRKVAVGVFVLNRLARFRVRTLLISAYYAYIYSHLAYSIVLWGGSGAVRRLERAFRWKKQAVSVVAGLKWGASCREAFRSNNILTVPSLYIFEMVCYARKKGSFWNPEVHVYNTRTRNAAVEPHRVALEERRPTYAGRRFFHHLSEQITQIEDDVTIKKKLKTFLISKAYYTVDEFRNY